MITLIIGGAASGKSELAESIAVNRHGLPRYYLATMQPFDGECAARIRKHRTMRAGKEFITVERYSDLAGLELPEREGTVLLECLSNLAANELYPMDRTVTPAQALDTILTGIDRLARQCRDLVIVSNEVFAGGTDYAPGTEDYLHLLADANRALAARAHQVIEVVCGLPIYHKGGGV